jgi:hypothetical protein
MRLEAADALDYQVCGVPVATVSAQERCCMEETSDHVIGYRDGAQSGVHGYAFERSADRRLDQQVGGTGEVESVE